MVEMRSGKFASQTFGACPPKAFGFRYRTAHQKAEKLATGNFFSTLFALLEFNSLSLYKKDAKRHLFLYGGDEEN